MVMQRPKHLLILVIFSFTVMSSLPAVAQCRDTLFFDGMEEQAFYQWEVAVEITQLGSGAERAMSLTLNGLETLDINNDGVFCFTNTTQGGQPYSVQIVAQPVQGDVCRFDNANTGIATDQLLVQVICDAQRNLWDQLQWDQNDWN